MNIFDACMVAGVNARRLLPPHRSLLRQRYIESHGIKHPPSQTTVPAEPQLSKIGRDTSFSAGRSRAGNIYETSRGMDPVDDELVVTITRDRSAPLSGRRSRQSPNSAGRKVVYAGNVVGIGDDADDGSD